jgi:glucose dehydrogenase
VLVGIGAVRRARLPLVAGGGLLLALAGAWVIGLPGVALGLVALAFWRRRRSGA